MMYDHRPHPLHNNFERNGMLHRSLQHVLGRLFVHCLCWNCDVYGHWLKDNIQRHGADFLRFGC